MGDGIFSLELLVKLLRNKKISPDELYNLMREITANWNETDFSWEKNIDRANHILVSFYLDKCSEETEELKRKTE